MPRLLIVEDQLNLREVLKSAFEDEYEVKTASNGFEALEIISAWLPDVMITDYAMPGITGMQVIREIDNIVGARHAVPLPGEHRGSAQQNAKIKIILFSACMTDEIKQEAKALGVAACLDKPFDLMELKALVGEMMSK